MNKELLQNRMNLIEEHIKKINNDIKQNMANLNALEGSKLECSYWLKELEKKDENQLEKEIPKELDEVCESMPNQ